MEAERILHLRCEHVDLERGLICRRGRGRPGRYGTISIPSR